MSFFRAVPAATQTISDTPSELIYGTELSDPDNVFASNRFTVPSGWNGRTGCLCAGLRITATTTSLTVTIEKQTGGSGSFETIARNIVRDSANVTVSTAPLVFATGDVYRVVAIAANSRTRENALRNFFAGWVYPATVTKLGFFEAQPASAPALAVNTITRLDLGNEIVDSHNLFASSIVTVPSDFNGGFLHLAAGADINSPDAAVFIQVSTDGGTNWTSLAAEAINATGSQFRRTVNLGAIAAVTGHQYRAAYFQATSGAVHVVGPVTFFSGLFFKY